MPDLKIPELQPGQVPVFLVEPCPQSFVTVKERLRTKEKTIALIEGASTLEVINPLRQLGVGVLLCHIPDTKAVMAVQSMLRLVAPMIKSGSLKVLCTTTIKALRLFVELQKMGCNEVLQEPVAQRAFEFKIQRFVDTVSKKLAVTDDSGGVKDRRKGTEKAKNQGAEEAAQSKDTIHFVDPVSLASDCWLTKGGGAKRIIGRWRVRLMGPSPAVGRWVEVEQGRGETKGWKWAPHKPAEDKFIKDPGAWVYFGAKPEFAEERWAFVGKKPRMVFFNEKNELVCTKFEVDDKSVLRVARDSQAGLAFVPEILESLKMEVLLREEAKKAEGGAESFEGEHRKGIADAKIEKDGEGAGIKDKRGKDEEASDWNQGDLSEEKAEGEELEATQEAVEARELRTRRSKKSEASLEGGKEKEAEASDPEAEAEEGADPAEDAGTDADEKTEKTQKKAKTEKKAEAAGAKPEKNEKVEKTEHGTEGAQESEKEAQAKQKENLSAPRKGKRATGSKKDSSPQNSAEDDGEEATREKAREDARKNTEENAPEKEEEKSEEKEASDRASPANRKRRKNPGALRAAEPNPKSDAPYGDQIRVRLEKKKAQLPSGVVEALASIEKTLENKPEIPALKSGLLDPSKKAEGEPLLGPLAIAFLASELNSKLGITSEEATHRFCSYLGEACRGARVEAWACAQEGQAEAQWRVIATSDHGKPAFEAHVKACAKALARPGEGIAVVPVLIGSQWIGALALQGGFVDRLKDDYLAAVARVAVGLFSEPSPQAQARAA